jgi:CheY-like chemotaxis protein
MIPDVNDWATEKELCMAVRVLIGWDDESEARSIRDFLGGHGIGAAIATSREAVEAAAERLTFDAILLALRLVGEEGAQAVFEKWKAHQPEAWILIVGSEEENRRLEARQSDELLFRLLRDAQGDFVLLLPTLIRGARDTKGSRRRAKRVGEIAKLMEELGQDTDAVRHARMGSLLEEMDAILRENAAELSDQMLAELTGDGDERT